MKKTKVMMMSERYLIMGTQLGMFEALAKAEQPEEIKKLVDEIIDKQFVGRTKNNIKDDVKSVLHFLIRKEGEKKVRQKLEEMKKK